MFLKAIESRQQIVAWDHREKAIWEHCVKLWRQNFGCGRNLKIREMPALWDIRKQEQNYPERCMQQVVKLEESSYLNLWQKPKTFHMELQDLVSALYYFSPVWINISSLYADSSFLEQECLFCAIICWTYVVYWKFIWEPHFSQYFQSQKRLWTLPFWEY